MAAVAEVAKRRMAAFERVQDALGLYRVVPPAKASEIERDRFTAEVLADMAEKLASVANAVEALEKRVAQLEAAAKPKRKPAAKAASEAK